MIRRRGKPDGLPYRLYMRAGKRLTSFGYKLPDGTWAFRLSAPTANRAKVAQVRREAIEQANKLNGDPLPSGTLTALVNEYFEWQDALPFADERRKAPATLKENRREAKWLVKVFGQMLPGAITKQHCYQYLDGRAMAGAPAKANKEIALLSAILEFGIRRGRLESNPCADLKYNPTRPRTRLVTRDDIEFALTVARAREGSYLILALAAKTAYLALLRPDETRHLRRQSDTPDGLAVPVGKRKAGQAEKLKLAHWTPALRAVIDEAIALQRTRGMFIFGNRDGQAYTRDGWSSIWRRLMKHCQAQDPTFEPFALRDMRPAGLTAKKERGDMDVVDAMGHSSERMSNVAYDRRRARKFDPVE